MKYEPELMFALDSKDEFADWRNVYNVSGDDVYYCPICMGKVKLWNGQDPKRIYKKQKCFHHMPGEACSKESLVHFAYKNWLLEPGSEFMVGEDKYITMSSSTEKVFHTSFGNYKPDITIVTDTGKQIFAEVKFTNGKDNSYLPKWDELGCDVIEIDVNEQLDSARSDTPPVFKMLYSSELGKCYLREYVDGEFLDVIEQCKIKWSRAELIEKKIQWEKLDWFWLKLCSYLNKDIEAKDVFDSFNSLESDDKSFIYKRLKGSRHIALKEILQNCLEDREYAKLNCSDNRSMVRFLNSKFGLSTSYGYTYLFKKDGVYIFRTEWRLDNARSISCKEITEPVDLYNYFLPIMEKHYLEVLKPEREDAKRRHELALSNLEFITPFLVKISEQIKNSRSGLWQMICSYKLEFNNTLDIKIHLISNSMLTLRLDEHEYTDDDISIIKEEITKKMRELIKFDSYTSWYSDTCILEVR